MQLRVDMLSVSVPGLPNEPGVLGLFSPQKVAESSPGRQRRRKPSRSEFEPGFCDPCGPCCPHLWGWRKRRAASHAFGQGSFETGWEDLKLQAQNLAMEAFT